MEPGDRDLEDGGAAADPSDLIVGTIEPPAWLGRIPALAWLFVGLAVFDAGYRVWIELDRGAGTSPTNVVYLALSVVRGAAIVLLPAAMLIGRKGLGRGESWMFQGAVALVVAELIDLVGRRVIDAVVGPQILDTGGDDTFVVNFVLESLVVAVPVAILTFFGLAKVGLGLDAIRGPDRPIGRIVVGVLAASLAVILVGDVVTIQNLRADSTQASVLVAYNLLVVVIGLLVAALWAWVATIAARRAGPPWPWLWIGAVAPVLQAAIGTAGLLLALQVVATGNALTVVEWFGIAAIAVSAFGAILLLAGFGRGFEPEDEVDDEDDALPDAVDGDTIEAADARTPDLSPGERAAGA